LEKEEPESVAHATNGNILIADSVSVDYKVSYGSIHGLRDVSLSIRQGEVLSLVGESGCGKSTFALAVSRLLAPNAKVSSDSKILFRGTDLMKVKRSKMDSLRGTEIFMIFQNPFMSLNPLMRIKDQIGEAIKVRDRRKGGGRGHDRGDVEREIVSVLKSVRIGDAGDIIHRYPHQLSGGQNQRVMLAMALAEKPSLLIADEPTTALDVTTQAQVLSLIKEVIRKTGMSMLFITHDLAVASSISDRIAVLYGGMLQEIGSSKQILTDPKHPYTVGLIESIPKKSKKEGHLDAIRGSFTLAGLENMCAFVPRCPLVHDTCKERVPALVQVAPGRSVRCVNYTEVG
jgi:peptide/nickel transport system ATP-binding protein